MKTPDPLIKLRRRLTILIFLENVEISLTKTPDHDGHLSKYVNTSIKRSAQNPTTIVARLAASAFETVPSQVKGSNLGANSFNVNQRDI